MNQSGLRMSVKLRFDAAKVNGSRTIPSANAPFVVIEATTMPSPFVSTSAKANPSVT